MKEKPEVISAKCFWSEPTSDKELWRYYMKIFQDPMDRLIEKQAPEGWYKVGVMYDIPLQEVRNGHARILRN